MQVCVALVTATIGAFSANLSAKELTALSVADTVETSRIVHVRHPIWSRDASGEWKFNSEGYVAQSPDQTRYAAMLVRGDLQRNGNWAQIVVGGLGSLAEARQHRTLAELFTRSQGDNFGAISAADLTLGANREDRLVWLPDSRRIAFKWVDEQEVVQLFTVDVNTKEIRQLTHHPTHVTSWGISPTGAIVYAAKESDAEVRAAHGLKTDEGFALTPADPINAFGLLAGLQTSHRYKNLQQQFVVDRPGQPYRRIESGAGVNLTPFSVLVFSPDGRYALTIEPPATIPNAWAEYEHARVKEWLKMRGSETDDSFYGVSQVFLIDLQRGHSQPLWDAPIVESRTRFAWAPDGQSVLLTDTYLPIASLSNVDASRRRAGLVGAATVEVSLATQEHLALPISKEESRSARLRWLPNGEVHFSGEDGRELAFAKSKTSWEALPPSDVHEGNMPNPPIRVECRQDPNTPPVLVAIDAKTHRTQVILDPNPELKRTFTLGEVEDVQWRDSTRREWAGRLYRPTGYVNGRRYPLVIQDNGTFLDRRRRLISQEFSLDGSLQNAGLGPGISVFAAQPLANHGIAVLQLTSEPEPGELGTPIEGEIAIRVYESAIAHLVGTGLVDSSRVGLAGFSRTGYRVLFALTHSTFPYAAALISDNVDFGYSQRLFYVDNPEFERVNGAEPFGEGLKSWLRNAPGFNVEKIHTPLRLHNESGPLSATLFMGWEIFSRMRTLSKPVELYVIPDIEHGAHGVQSPKQVLANKQGAVDWFDFWLNARQDDSGKSDQYARWQRLRELHERDLAAGSMRHDVQDSSSFE